MTTTRILPPPTSDGPATTVPSSPWPNASITICSTERGTPDCLSLSRSRGSCLGRPNRPTIPGVTALFVARSRLIGGHGVLFIAIWCGSVIPGEAARLGPFASTVLRSRDSSEPVIPGMAIRLGPSGRLGMFASAISRDRAGPGIPGVAASRLRVFSRAILHGRDSSGPVVPGVTSPIGKFRLRYRISYTKLNKGGSKDNECLAAHSEWYLRGGKRLRRLKK